MARQVSVSVQDPSHPLWAAMAADVGYLYRLPRGLCELIAGRVRSVSVSLSDSVVFDTIAKETMAFLQGRELGQQSGTLPYTVTTVSEGVPKPPSEREHTAEIIASFVRQCSLDAPYGGDVMRHTKGKYYAVAFSHGDQVAGLVRLYSVGYVTVAFSSQDRHGSRLFGSAQDALRFLQFAFVERNWHKAMGVPLREGSR